MQEDYLKVRGHSHLVREKKSHGILNTDLKSLNKYKEEREEKIRLSQVVEENNNIKNELAEIKFLLQALLGQK